MTQPLHDTTLNHWLIVDLIRVPQAARTVYEQEPQPEMTRLFAQSRLAHLLDQSPGLFRISAGSSLLRQIGEHADWRSSSIIYSTPSAISREALTTHLQHLLIVRIAGRQTLFRYYSSDFLGRVAAWLNGHDIQQLLGPAKALSWFASDTDVRQIQRAPDVAVEPPTYVLTSPVFLNRLSA